MTTIADQFEIDSANVVKSSIAAETDNSGYSAKKHINKVAACETAAALCANSQVKLNLTGNLVVSNALNSTTAYYFGVADALCGSRLMGVYDIMSTNLALITPDYLKAPQLAAFLSQITAFTGLTGTTSAANEGLPVLTDQFATDLKVTNADVLTIKKAGLKYKSSNPSFYNGLLKACKIPAIAVRHTTVVMKISDANTTGVIAGVAGTLTKTKKLPVSNVSGIMTYTTVQAGDATATFTKKGYITKVIPVHIFQGGVNTSIVTLMPGIMTPEQEETIKETLAAAVASEKAAIAANKKTKKVAKPA